MTPAEAHSLAQKQGLLPMWTVYDHPRDYPNCFVARMFVVGAGVSGPTTADVVGDSLIEIREKLPPGLFNLGRNPGDDENIVEVWI